MKDADWYADGLHFECSRCGNCCTGEPGLVRMTDDEVRTMARHVEMDEANFRDQYTYRLSSGGTTLRERSNGACVFWRPEVGCLVYPVRPRQCRTWPFWRMNVASPLHWAAAAKTCPGIDAGPRHSAEVVRETSETDGTSGKIPEL